jgi:hypothetical protein
MNTPGIWIEMQKAETMPVQNDLFRGIPKPVAEEAYKEYSTQFGVSQSLERICERQGFGAIELAMLLYIRIKRLEEELASVHNKYIGKLPPLE